jgi:hypothetical protein
LFRTELEPEFAVGRHREFLWVSSVDGLLFVLRVAPPDDADEEHDGEKQAEEQR